MQFNPWNPAKIWTGSNSQRCAECDEYIERGQMSKQNWVSGHIYHDDCAEDVGAYANS